MKNCGAPLQPAALALRAQFETAASELIDRLLRKKSFDAIADLATFLPASLVSNLVGLPEKGREQMLDWAAAAFDSMGPANARTEACFAKIAAMIEFIASQAGPLQVRQGSWAARLYGAANAGLITREQVLPLILDYVGPSLDTTINATGHLLFNLAHHPEQWQLLRSRPELIPAAINEVVRFESPIRGFTRFAPRDEQIDGIPLPGGSRVLILYASANRDERYWSEPDRFDIRRANVATHLGFGFGRHTCAGMHLARLEISSLLTSLIRRVDRLMVGEPTIVVNSILRGYATLPLTLS